ncbi:unnamed protein product [Amoebophrya sp. A25]|nr:unnamed protein product [Amoebophrya sp. A25]|eukprot:GSA25T00012919001.1
MAVQYESSSKPDGGTRTRKLFTTEPIRPSSNLNQEQQDHNCMKILRLVCSVGSLRQRLRVSASSSVGSTSRSTSSIYFLQQDTIKGHWHNRLYIHPVRPNITLEPTYYGNAETRSNSKRGKGLRRLVRTSRNL